MVSGLASVVNPKGSLHTRAKSRAREIVRAKNTNTHVTSVTHTPITPTFPSTSSHEIDGDYVEKQMSVDHF